VSPEEAEMRSRFLGTTAMAVGMVALWGASASALPSGILQLTVGQVGGTAAECSAGGFGSAGATVVFGSGTIDGQAVNTCTITTTNAAGKHANFSGLFGGMTVDSSVTKNSGNIGVFQDLSLQAAFSNAGAANTDVHFLASQTGLTQPPTGIRQTNTLTTWQAQEANQIGDINAHVRNFISDDNIADETGAPAVDIGNAGFACHNNNGNPAGCSKTVTNSNPVPLTTPFAETIDYFGLHQATVGWQVNEDVFLCAVVNNLVNELRAQQRLAAHQRQHA